MRLDLHAATESGKISGIRLLLELGAELKSQRNTRLKRTLLEACAGGGWGDFGLDRAEAFRCLLQSGAETNLPRTPGRFSNWNSALTILITRQADKELIHILLDQGADVNEGGGGDGARTPIQAAAERGSLELVERLFTRGANINAPAAFKNGRTALQAACSGEDANMDLVKFLLDNGANANADAGVDGGLTALPGAAVQGHINIAPLLLHDFGADVNADPAILNGRTALDGAAEHGRLDMVRILLNAIANCETERESGYGSAEELAEKNGHYGIVDLLVQFNSQ